MMISIVITVKNEAEGMNALLDSLLVQEKPFEIIIVDANSNDGTQDIVNSYSSKHPEIKLIEYDATRGESRNKGVKHAKGEIIAFTDGGCTTEKNWLHEIRKNLTETYDIVAGKTIPRQQNAFTSVSRVEVYHKNGDASFPTCNIAYKKALFERIKGFDSWFKEAEDVDLNYRALDQGANMKYDENMIIYRKGAESFSNFIKKSFWYGFGRKELEIRHGSLWSNYDVGGMIGMKKDESFWKFIRLSIAFLGYIFCIFVGNRSKTKEKMRNSNFHSH